MATVEEKYTMEQKIVAACWVHEKKYNNQSWTDITTNFKVRFGLRSPSEKLLIKWEKQLFNSGSVVEKRNKPHALQRLVHVPYVKASLKEHPYLNAIERARLLGIHRSQLLTILKEDLHMKFNEDRDSPKGGMWVSISKEEKESDTESDNEQEEC